MSAKNSVVPRSINTLVFFDLETTGLLEDSPAKITELNLCSIERNQFIECSNQGELRPRVTNSLNLCVNPCRNLHPKAAEMSKLNKDDHAATSNHVWQECFSKYIWIFKQNENADLTCGPSRFIFWLPDSQVRIRENWKSMPLFKLIYVVQLSIWCNTNDSFLEIANGPLLCWFLDYFQRNSTRFVTGKESSFWNKSCSA